MENLIVIAWFIDSGELYSLRILPDNYIGRFMKSRCSGNVLPFGKQQIFYSGTTAFEDFLCFLGNEKRTKLESIVKNTSNSLDDSNGLYLGAWDLIQ